MPGLIVLPNSGMAIRFSRAMGLNPDLTANEEFHTKPDVAVEQSLEDLCTWLDSLDKNGFPTEPMPSCDSALRKCLELIADNSPLVSGQGWSQRQPTTSDESLRVSPVRKSKESD
jgi:hypothetical protein